MKTVNVLQVGITSKGDNWARIETIKSGFKLTGFVKPVEALEVGEQELPTEVLNAVEFKA